MIRSLVLSLILFTSFLLAGWIISAFGVSRAFFVNALDYLILTLAFLALRTPQGYSQTSPDPGSVFDQIRDGVNYLLRDRSILTFLILGVTVNAMTMGTFFMLPAYSELILGMGVEGMAIVLAVEGLGATATALWIARGGARVITPDRVLWSVPVAVIAAAALTAVKC